MFELPLRSSIPFKLAVTNIEIDYYQIHPNQWTNHTQCAKSQKEKQIKSSHEKSWNKLRKWKLFADPSVRSWPTNPAQTTQFQHAGVCRMRKPHAFKQTGKHVGLKGSRTAFYLGFFEENVSYWIILNSLHIVLLLLHMQYYFLFPGWANFDGSILPSACRTHESSSRLDSKSGRITKPEIDQSNVPTTRDVSLLFLKEQGYSPTPCLFFE